MFNWTSRLALPLKKNPKGLSSVPQVQSLKERLSAVVKSHLRENFMEFSALPATNTTRRWVPAVQYTPVELLDRVPRRSTSPAAVTGPTTTTATCASTARSRTGTSTSGYYVGIVKAKIKFFDYRGGGQYAPTQKASELVDPKYIYLVDFPTRKLMGEKIQVDNMEEIIKQYKRGEDFRKVFRKIGEPGAHIHTAQVMALTASPTAVEDIKGVLGMKRETCVNVMGNLDSKNIILASIKKTSMQSLLDLDGINNEPKAFEKRCQPELKNYQIWLHASSPSWYADFEETKDAFHGKIEEAVREHNIPDEMVVNWDQTGINVVPDGGWTLAEGSRQVPIIGLEDKRQFSIITLTCCFSE
ncbi:hypothetical protein Bbelb_291470 [Branchiostoma belcheri]|nr:hypothetical protein Bbelb_291470 [Branchiostoma belcheri]